jgi:PAS domain S-box-containing protein
MRIEEIAALGFEQVVRSAPLAIAVIDGSGRVIHSNARARELTGRLGREMPADLDGAIDIFHPDGRRYERDEWPAVRSLAAGEVIADEEFFYAVPDGERMWIRCSCSPVRDTGGEIVAAVLAMGDITEHRREEERLCYMAGLLDNTEDAIVAFDAQWFVTVWNAGAERLYGWTEDEVLGRHTLEVARLELSQEERTEFRLAVAEQGRVRAEAIAYRKDGAPVWVEVIAVALRGPRGEITGYLGIHRDVSERKTGEEALREADRRSETILESIAEAFVAVDGEWRYTYVNDRALGRMRVRSGRADLRREDVLGEDMWTLFPDVVDSEIYERYHEAMRERRPLRFESYFEPSDEWIGARVYPADGGLAIYYDEITERKRAGREGHRSEATLERITDDGQHAEAQLARWAQQQAVLADLGQRALAGDAVQGLMDDAVAVVARTLDVELVAVVELLPGARQVLIRAGVGWRPGAVGRATAASERSFVGYAATAGPVTSHGLADDERFTISPFLKSHQPVSAAAVSIASRDSPYGALGVFSREARGFSADEVTFLQSVANVISTAVNRDAVERRVDEVRETERRRIARDLHDEALQELTAAIATTTDERLRPSLKAVGQQLRGAIYDLRLEEESSRGFADALRDLVALQREMSPANVIELDVGQGTPQGQLGKHGAEILRIAGEALTNARRHSGARAIRVSTQSDGDRLRVDVSDDGAGFDPAQPTPLAQSAGLRGIRERARLLGAALEIDSAAGRGTTVRLSVPLDELRTPGETMRILLVDDHAASREPLAVMLDREPDLEVSAHAASLSEARGVLEQVDVALIDLELPDGSGIDLIKDLRLASPRAHALVFSASVDRLDTARAIQAGAAAVLAKTAPLDEIVDAVRRLRAGETLLPLDEVVDLLRFGGERQPEEHDARRAIEQLTTRELEVLQALAEGLDSQAVADRLFITLRTERNHVANMLAKLGVHSQLQALVFALRHGVIELR